MNYRSAFIAVTSMVMIALFVSYSVYTNSITVQTVIAAQNRPVYRIENKQNKTQRVIDITRNFTSTAVKQDQIVFKPRCKLPFNCSKGKWKC